MTATNAVGVLVDEVGRLVVKYFDKDGQRQTLDLTAEIERIAAEAVARHAKDYHGS